MTRSCVLIGKILRRAGIANDIVSVNDGQKAVDFLLKQKVYEHNTLTDPLLFCST